MSLAPGATLAKKNLMLESMSGARKNGAFFAQRSISANRRGFIKNELKTTTSTPIERIFTTFANVH